MEPELLSNLMKLLDVLANATVMSKTLSVDKNFEFTTAAELFLMYIYNAVEAAQKAKALVVRQATNRTNTDEFALELKKTVQQ
jgi:hypothetical protein